MQIKQCFVLFYFCLFVVVVVVVVIVVDVVVVVETHKPFLRAFKLVHIAIHLASLTLSHVCLCFVLVEAVPMTSVCFCVS